LQGAIEFRHVTFRYKPDEPPALVDFSVRIPYGRFVAIVGGSGAGKSTMVDLLLGLFEPTKGAILVDGTELRTCDLVAWRGRLGVVDQDPFLFHATIRENIAYGKPDATTEEIMAAVRAAHAEGFIARLSDGYETVIGERGCRLSGGQRQRIAPARALVRKPDVLILDEATSALDSESERQIRSALEEQRGQRTILTIAHRLSTISRADQIGVLMEGKLVAQGTHQQLLMRNGPYAHSWRLQSEGHEQMDCVPLKTMAML
jgi:ATP-binding cassette subfamily B protein/subfamily B ATP-binding cassette protein MsbA